MKDGPRPLRDWLPPTLRDLGVPAPGELDRLLAVWPKAAGGRLAGAATPVALRGQCLTLRVASDVIRYEIQSFHRDRLLAALQEALPDVVISRLRVVV